MKDPLADALLDALNAAADAVLSVDPDGRRRLAELQGKVLCIEVTAPTVTLYMLPAVTGIDFRRALDDENQTPDVTISGSAFALANLARAGGDTGGGDNAAHEKPRVTVRGDAEAGQAFRKIIADFDLDWEELLARAIGDTPARIAGNALRRFGGWAEESFDLARENAADYLTEEKRVLVTDAALRRFARAVDQTRADVDRLAQRVQRIKRAVESRAELRGSHESHGSRAQNENRDRN